VGNFPPAAKGLGKPHGMGTNVSLLECGTMPPCPPDRGPGKAPG
jgi:hypothetical protein